jgi:TolB-like protein
LSTARAKKLDRIAAAYAVAGWLVVQAASIALPAFGTPTWALRTIIAVALIGFPVALFVAWYSIPHPHPETIAKGEGLTRGEFMLLGLLGAVLLLTLVQLAYELSGRAQQSPSATALASPRAPSTTASGDAIRVAVVPFDIIGTGSDATHTFANTLLDKIVETLSANQVETVSRSDSLLLRGGTSKANTALAELRVGMTLEGSVENDGKTITVRLHLDDVHQHETLWSRTFQGSAISPEPLQTQIALHATDVTRWAVSPRLESIRSDPSLVAAYLEGEDEEENGGGGRALAIARELVARAPRFAAAHTLLATAVGQGNGLAVVTPEARAEMFREAKTAIALGGGDGQAYTNLARNLPVLAFKERENLLLKGLAIEPGSPDANWDYIELLLSAGRIEDALVQARSAWTLAPFTVWLASILPVTLATAGRIDEARDAIADMKRKWPDSPDIAFKWTEFTVESQQPPFARALAMLDDKDLQRVLESPPYGKPGAIDVLRTATQARLLPLADRRTAAQRVENSVYDDATGSFFGIALLSALGDVDGAFRAADRVLTREKVNQVIGVVRVEPLFGIQTIAMRRDRRFMQLAQRIGLVDYWRSTGHWPDFCSDPGLPYDCKVEAARLATMASGTRH